ncbi:MAG: PD-(D/E)XK nuclease family protein, partial [Myxococcota bacterium]|nr:PD-(D/E)XK nuclease family protein [Myxococcota bacterium]
LTPGTSENGLELPVPLAGFPAGAEAGTFLHALFEEFDFAAAHPNQEEPTQALEALINELAPIHGFEGHEALELLPAGMLAALRTPLGGPLGQHRLCDIKRNQRIDELRFEFPIAGGNQWRQQSPHVPLEAHALARCFRHAEAMSPSYRKSLDGLKFGRLAGFMTGYIDAIYRIPTNDGFKWFVVDYKSNRLDPARQGLHPVSNYQQRFMTHEMEQHHYYIQYHIYVLALHRYLKTRLGEDYEYERDMGGVYYLFFRGMVGPETPSDDHDVHGVFYDKPDLSLIESLSTLFGEPSTSGVVS